MGEGLGVVGMKVLCRGLLTQLKVPVKALVAYTLSQAVSLIVIGADTVPQVQELAWAAQNFAPMTPEEQRTLEEAVAPFARKLMYYKS